MTMATIRSAVDARTREKLPARRGTRWLGAVVAIAIAAVPATAGLFLAGNPFLVLGLPAAAVAGVVLGPSIRAREPVAGVVVAMATLSIGVGYGIVVGSMIVDAAAGSSGLGFGPGSVWTGIAYVAMLGLMIVGVPMLLVTVPCAMVWGFVVRRLIEGGRGIPVR
jgi:hypothetical protein